MVSNIHDQSDAERVADAYHTIPLAGHYAHWGGQQEAKKIIDHWHPGYTLEAGSYMQTLTNEKEKSTIINFNGTESPADAWATWSAAASPQQGLVLEGIGRATEELARQTGLASVYEQFRIGGTFAVNKLTQNVPSLEDRVNQGIKAVQETRASKPDHHVLLTGYSLGGLVARRVAEDQRTDALLFNSAIGKHKVDRSADKRIIEFRISGDPVSKRFDGAPQYTFERTTQLPKGDVSAWRRLITDTDRLGQPTDPIQSHWLENFSLSKERLHDQLMSADPRRTRNLEHRHPSIDPRKDLFSVGLRCRPCKNGKLFCNCK